MSSARTLRLEVWDGDDVYTFEVGIDLEGGLVFRPNAGRFAGAFVCEADPVRSKSDTTRDRYPYRVRVEVLP